MIDSVPPAPAAVIMSSSRDFPFSFSSEVRAVLSSPDALNLSVRAAFPELHDG